MDKPRIFLGSSGKQAKLVQALTRGLEDVAHVEPWTTSFNPGTSTLERLLELTREVDFAAFVFARDDWTANSPPAADPAAAGQASPRDNVVFEAGLFGGVLGMRRTFILHASGAKLPSDLLGLTCVRYGDATTATEVRTINQKLRKAIEDEGRVARIEGLWWQFSLTERSSQEPSAVSLLRISRDRDGVLEVSGRSWQEDGTLSARYWSEAAKERKDPAGRLLLLERRTAAGPERAAVGRDGRDPMRVRRSRGRLLHDSLGNRPEVNARTSGVYVRADPEDLSILDGPDDRQRAELIADAAQPLEVDDERLTSVQAKPCLTGSRSASGRRQKPVEVGPAVELAIGDDGTDLLGVADVFEGVGVEQHEIGELAGLDPPQASPPGPARAQDCAWLPAKPRAESDRLRPA